MNPSSQPQTKKETQHSKMARGARKQRSKGALNNNKKAKDWTKQKSNRRLVSKRMAMVGCIRHSLKQDGAVGWLALAGQLEVPQQC
jgi:hypothetical protein